MARMTGQQALVEMLRAEGVRYVFGNPGTTELPFLDALQDAPDIQYVTTLFEGGGGGNGGRVRPDYAASFVYELPHLGGGVQQHRRDVQLVARRDADGDNGGADCGGVTAPQPDALLQHGQRDAGVHEVGGGGDDAEGRTRDS